VSTGDSSRSGAGVDYFENEWKFGSALKVPDQLTGTQDVAFAGDGHSRDAFKGRGGEEIGSGR
jgi:hypothetical protein